MAYYYWKGPATGGNWDTAADWSGTGTSFPDSGDDTADFTVSTPLSVVTNGETVGAVIGGFGAASIILKGAGLTVKGAISGVTLEGGGYSAGMFGGTLAAGQLSGGSINATVTGGAVTNSDNFQGTVSGGTVKTKAVTSILSIKGGSVTAVAVSALSVNISAGALNTQSATCGANATFSVTGGTFTDSGALATSGGNFSVSGSGTATVAGAATESGGGQIAVTGGALKLNGGLAVGPNSGFAVSGGKMTVTGTTTLDSGGNGVGGAAVAGATAVVTFNGALKVGETGDDAFAVTSGTVNVSASGLALQVGEGAVSIGGGTAFSVTGDTMIGDRARQVGSLTLSANSGDTPVVTLGGALTMGVNGGTGNLTVGVTNFLNYPGTLKVSGATVLGKATGDTATLLMGGGSATLVQLGGATTIGLGGNGTANVYAGTLHVSGALTVGGEAKSQGAVTVQSAVLFVGADTTIAESGAGGLTIIDGAVWNATHDVTVGEKADSVGRLTVEAESYLTGQTKNAHATIDGDLTVGGKGAGTLGIGAGGAVTVGGALVFAEDEKSNGMLNEIGAGAVLTVTGPVTVGEAGTAVATVQAGGRFDASANDVTVGEEAKGQGLLVVTGAGSEIETAALTVAGASKDDNAEALSGGKLLVGGDLTIGDEQGSDGAVTVNDSGSALIVDGDATIGADGSGALLMTGGSASVKGAMTLGEAKNSTGKVILSAASLSVSGKLTIGELGSATALVQQGATVKSGAIEIGAGLGAKGSLTIDGSASSVTSGEITIGDGGVGSLKLTNGAKLTSGGDATIGNVALGAIVSASLDTGASWTVKGGLTVGDGGAASFSIAGKQTQVVVDGDMTVGASAGGTATLGSSTAASAATVEWGGVLTVGEGGKGALNINAGDSATALAGGPGALVIGEKAGSSGAVALLGAGARLTGADLVVGGAAAKAGGSGALSLAAGTQASFSAATIWKTGKVTDSGALTIGGPVSGNGKLQIMSGGLLTLNGSDTTVGLDFVAGGKGETLDLSADHLPAVQLVGFASSDVVDVAGLGHHDTISMKISGASAIVDFLQSGKAVGRLDFAVAAGQHDAFHFDAGTGALTLAAAH